MVQSFSSSVYYMFPLETFPSLDVLEQDPQLRSEVVSDVDLLCACIPDLNLSVIASPCYEVPPSPQQTLMHWHC
jgi:hypothetical protein